MHFLVLDSGSSLLSIETFDRGLLAGGGLLLVLQAALIAALLVQRTRRRRAERAVRETDERFRLMADAPPVLAESRQAEREREDLTRHLRDLAGRLIAAQEVERTRIARDLHDDVSQQIAALSIALSSLRRRAAAMPDGADLQDDFSSLQQRTNTLAESVRDLSHDLHPDVLLHVGLATALAAYCNELSLSRAVAVTCSAQGNFESIDPEAALCLYRIAQEALRNVVKHAEARHAEVRVLRTGDGAELMIADDGKGFDIDTRKNGTGLGLVSIIERARLSGGTVSIVTALNKGTRVLVRIPIHVSHDSRRRPPVRTICRVGLTLSRLAFGQSLLLHLLDRLLHELLDERAQVARIRRLA